MLLLFVFIVVVLIFCIKVTRKEIDYQLDCDSELEIEDAGTSPLEISVSVGISWYVLKHLPKKSGKQCLLLRELSFNIVKKDNILLDGSKITSLMLQKEIIDDIVSEFLKLYPIFLEFYKGECSEIEKQDPCILSIGALLEEGYNKFN